MVKITYVEFNGTAHPVEVKPGQSLMEGAVRNGVPGIEAECGGACSCATCHVYVDPAWFERTGARTKMEQSMLDYANEVQAFSRLACQIKVDQALDGLVVSMPQSQG
jgi:2Fe-2S ferredoxin